MEDKLLNFVRGACTGRDSSHNHEHMQVVAQDALQIFDHTVGSDHPRFKELRELVEVSAWLHDVPDHKYDRDGTLKSKCENFMSSELGFSAGKVGLVMGIIDRVSFSKEDRLLKTGDPNDWLETLGEDGVLVRNIVSDSDKIQAIGEIGIERCALYTREHQPNIDRSELKQKISEHAEEKLLRLYTEFIRTEHGKSLAKPHHNRMVEILDDLDGFLDKMEK